MQTLRLNVNGVDLEARALDPHVPLLHLLRERGLTGTKEGCAEGECGACAVVVVRRAADGTSRYVPVNSCLVLAAAMHEQEILTVEGLARTELHPVQSAMVEHAGSQCGYCTPGFVMSLFAEYYREGREAGEFDPEAIGGNLCRCTGYRPIKDALVSLRVPSEGDGHAARLSAEAPPLVSVAFEGEVPFFRPATLDEAFEVMAANPNAVLLSGGTDLVVEINQRERTFEGILSLEGIDALRGITETDEALVLGAGVPLSELESTFHAHPTLRVFDELFPLFSSRLIRNRATLGGNLANASPIGDSPPALLALDAEVILVSRDGERTVSLAEFFTGYRQTQLAPGELIRAVRIPKPFPTVNRFYKVSKRVMDDISTVAAGFGLWLEGETITKARLAYGGVAATPVRAKLAEECLVGRTFDAMALVEASAILEESFKPMSDHRGSARYRAAMVPRLLEKLHAELTHAETSARMPAE